MSNKPKNVTDHWHYFPEGMAENDDYRVDICRLKQDKPEDPKFVVWILETDVTVPFPASNEAVSFVKDFILGRHAKRAVDISNSIVP